MFFAPKAHRKADGIVVKVKYTRTFIVITLNYLQMHLHNKADACKLLSLPRLLSDRSQYSTKKLEACEIYFYQIKVGKIVNAIACF